MIGAVAVRLESRAISDPGPSAEAFSGAVAAAAMLTESGVAVAAAPATTAIPATPASTGTTHTFDLYNPRAERWQDPDYTACTAASAMSMLNTIAYSGAPAGFVWKTNTSFSMLESVQNFERSNMTMLTSVNGSDPHGWRNALNHYGWGSVKAGVYADLSYPTFAAAEKAAVSALATTGKPVGILAVMGGHAVFMTGYKVKGDDPRTGSKSFTVLGVYLTDPLQSAGRRDSYVTAYEWRAGDSWVQFARYWQVDSPYRDPIDGKVGKTEWYGKWVIVAPVK
jgi:hypothetical protein